jgi:putative membrane protein
MLWIKSFHIFFVMAWFAGLFYLPRIFVNLALEGPSGQATQRLLIMARKLYRFTVMLSVVAVVLGLVLYLGYGIGRGPGNAWMHAKLALVILILGYQHACGRLLKKFEQGNNQHGHVWYRVFNESLVVITLVTVCLVIVKPF